jgi:hypothetical protein
VFEEGSEEGREERLMAASLGFKSECRISSQAKCEEGGGRQ